MAAACCGASPARVGACGRSRAFPRGWSRFPPSRCCRATSSPGRAWPRRSTAAAPPTTSCTRWSPPRADHFAARDRRAAEAFARAAAAAGLERIVYLGGIAPSGAPSAHLDSRLEVERILLDAAPGSTALRASIVVGACSPSFRVLVRLVERLRVLPLPRWRSNRTQPIDERDMIEFLARTPQTPAAAGRSLDVCGPDLMTYGEMIERIAEAMGVGRLPVELAASLTPPASAVVAAVSGQPLELVRPLMESLESDVLPRDADEAPRLYGIRPRGFGRAVEHALAEWESLEPLGAR